MSSLIRWVRYTDWLLSCGHRPISYPEYLQIVENTCLQVHIPKL